MCIFFLVSRQLSRYLEVWAVNSVRLVPRLSTFEDLDRQCGHQDYLSDWLESYQTGVSFPFCMPVFFVRHFKF